MSLEETLQKLPEVLGKHEKVCLAYLFGSTSRGDAREDSDLDIAVLLENESVALLQALWSDLHEVLKSRKLDLVLLKSADPVLCFEVLREGRLLYFRSEDELNAFERRAWNRYQDTRHLRAIGDMYCLERSEEWSSSRKPSGSA